MAADARVDPARWRAHLDELVLRLGVRFKRVEPRRLVGDLLTGMVSDLATKNCWTIAEHVGHKSPDRLQHLLREAVWDEDGILADLREYAVEHLGDGSGGDGILIVDETGDLKKGTHTVGVQRQYTGTAGRIENAQVAVYLTYSTNRGYTLVDRALYLPKAWAEDPERRTEAGVPGKIEFTTKPMLAKELIVRALDGGVNADWVAGDEVYGGDGKLRAALEARGVGYVLAVACSHQVITTTRTQRVSGVKNTKTGKTRTVLEKQRADKLAAGLPKQAWQQVSAGEGSKGMRLYDWAWIAIKPEPITQSKAKKTDTSSGNTVDPAAEKAAPTRSGRWWLLIRRNNTTGELAYYRCYATRPVPLTTLVHVAGRRWRVEESFQAGKNLAGLDQHQVRRWNSWHRWTLIAMLAHAFLAALAIDERARPRPDHDGIIALTCNEIHHLFNALLARTLDVAHRLSWSLWRRRHQYRARLSHYQRRGHTPPT